MILVLEIYYLILLITESFKSYSKQKLNKLLVNFILSIESYFLYYTINKLLIDLNRDKRRLKMSGLVTASTAEKIFNKSN